MKRENKLIRCFLFYGIFAGILAVLSVLFYPKSNTIEAGVPERDIKLSGIFGAPENSVDVVFLGDSVTYTSVAPLQMWDEQGIASYVCAQSGQKVTEAYYWLKKIYEKQTPKLLVLEANILYNYDRFEEETNAALETHLGYYIPIFKYHNRWRNLSADDFLLKFEKVGRDFARGYVEKTGAQAYSGGSYMKQGRKVDEIDEVAEFYLDGIRKLCEENGTTLVIVSVPSPRNWNYARHNGVEAYAKEQNLHYLDMNLHTKEMGIDWRIDTLDAGDHMNEVGAEKVTGYLGEYLKEEFVLVDHRADPKYEIWNENADDFEEQ